MSAHHPTGITPRVLGKYTLVGRLAAGGMGEIFLAELRGAAAFRRLCVIKRLLPHLAQDKEISELFLNEARLAAQLSHPNVCHVYELEQQDGEYFIAMEFLQGASLAELLSATDAGIGDARLVVSLFQQVCEGLHHVHELRSPSGRELRVVHRDVSPQNLFVTETGIVKILDFGVAKIRSAVPTDALSSLKGKFAYMSPEQLRGDDLDRRSDLFSLGSVLFEALTGKIPFARKTEALTAAAIANDEIPRLCERRPDLSPALEAVVARALSRARDERFDDARQLSRALVAAVDGPAYSAEELARELAPMMSTAVERQRRLVARVRSRSVEIAIPGEAGAAAGRLEASTVALGRPRDRAEPPVPDVGVTRRRSPLWWAGIVAVIALVAGGVAMIARDPDRVAEPAEPAPPPPSSQPTPVSLAPSHPSAEPAVAAPEPTAPAPALAATEPTPPARTGPPPAETPPAEATARPRRGPAAREPGWVSLDSDPYAVIFIDGKPAGDTPILRRRLAAGAHRIRAVLADGRSRTFTLDVAPGKIVQRKLEW